jgi:hypothetical protein
MSTMISWTWNTTDTLHLFLCYFVLSCTQKWGLKIGNFGTDMHIQNETSDMYAWTCYIKWYNKKQRMSEPSQLCVHCVKGLSSIYRLLALLHVCLNWGAENSFWGKNSHTTDSVMLIVWWPWKRWSAETYGLMMTPNEGRLYKDQCVILCDKFFLKKCNYGSNSGPPA